MGRSRKKGRAARRIEEDDRSQSPVRADNGRFDCDRVRIYSPRLPVNNDQPMSHAALDTTMPPPNPEEVSTDVSMTDDAAEGFPDSSSDFEGLDGNADVDIGDTNTISPAVYGDSQYDDCDLAQSDSNSDGSESDPGFEITGSARVQSSDKPQFLFSSPVARPRTSYTPNRNDAPSDVPSPSNRRQERENEARVLESKQLALLDSISNGFELIDERAVQCRGEIRDFIRKRSNKMFSDILKKLDELAPPKAGAGDNVPGSQLGLGWV